LITLDRLRRALATTDVTPQLAILGVLAGLSTGIVMLLFRASIQLPLMALLPDGNSENFEGLSATVRAVLVIGGALLLGLWSQRLDAQRQSVGVVHVMEQLSRNHGRLPLRNAIVQFVGGAVALLTGQSGGREGPAIHLGAATSSLFGQYLDLPNNSIRTLVACGTAAAIAGSFNTPLAGVIFAMEVVMMEYTIAGFTPVILAAVTSTLLSQAAFGNHTAFVVPGGIEIRSLFEYPVLLIEGLLIACIASALLVAMRWLGRRPIETPLARFAIAGVVTGVVSIAVPQVMGIGYDTVELALQGHVTFAALIAILLGKVITTAVSYALRMPIGIIGPALVIGACTGGVLGGIVQWVAPDFASHPAIYVMLGMGAMMGAVLQAPLSALIAVVELTNSPSITLPAMLVIVVATITTSALFKQRSVFLTALDARGLKYGADPISQHMRRTGVRSVMHVDFERLRQPVTPAELDRTLRSGLRWGVIDDTTGDAQFALNLTKLRQLVDERGDQHLQEGAADVDLTIFAEARVTVASIDVRATLYEAWEVLKDPAIGAICVRRLTVPGSPTLGVLSRDDVMQFAHITG
jgi:chloride channel protein, CIC family